MSPEASPRGSTSSEMRSVKTIMKSVIKLRADVDQAYKATKNEDLEHAGLGLQIVEHALGEVIEHKGLGGEIERVYDPKALKASKELERDVEGLQKRAQSLLKTHPKDEDLETAIKALEISKGSLEEVVERYGG